MTDAGDEAVDTIPSTDIDEPEASAGTEENSMNDIPPKGVTHVSATGVAVIAAGEGVKMAGL